MPAHKIDFWSRVDKSGDCWVWIGPVHASGYGSAGKRDYAHRVAYEQLVGPIPEGLELDHTCHNADTTCAGGNDCPHRRCVNPAHLEPVTHAENTRRGRSFAAIHCAKTECVNGHPFSPMNTYIRPCDGGRICRQCRRDASRRQRVKEAA